MKKSVIFKEPLDRILIASALEIYLSANSSANDFPAPDLMIINVTTLFPSDEKLSLSIVTFTELSPLASTFAVYSYAWSFLTNGKSSVGSKYAAGKFIVIFPVRFAFSLSVRIFCAL